MLTAKNSGDIADSGIDWEKLYNSNFLYKIIFSPQASPCGEFYGFGEVRLGQGRTVWIVPPPTTVSPS